MATIDPEMSYDEFCEGLVEFIIKNQKELKGKISGYAYQGFSPKEVFKMLLLKMANAKISLETGRLDIANMICIFLSRGPNVAKVRMD